MTTDLSPNQPNSDTSGAHVAAGDKEAVRTLFERTFQLDAPSRNDAGDYTERAVNVAWIAYQEGHAAGINGSPIIKLLAQIRAAAGDPLGRLDWDELVAHIAGLRVGAAESDIWKPSRR